MINADALRRASTALNAVFNAEQVSAFITATEHLLDGYVRQITAPPLPPDPVATLVEAETVVAKTVKNKSA